MRLFGLSLIVAAVVQNLLYCLWASPFQWPYATQDQILGFVYVKNPAEVAVLQAGECGLVLPILMLGAGLGLLFYRRRRVVEAKRT